MMLTLARYGLYGALGGVLAAGGITYREPLLYVALVIVAAIEIVATQIELRKS